MNLAEQTGRRLLEEDDSDILFMAEDEDLATAFNDIFKQIGADYLSITISDNDNLKQVQVKFSDNSILVATGLMRYIREPVPMQIFKIVEMGVGTDSKERMPDWAGERRNPPWSSNATVKSTDEYVFKDLGLKMSVYRFDDAPNGVQMRFSRHPNSGRFTNAQLEWLGNEVGGFLPGRRDTTTIFIHDATKAEVKHFSPVTRRNPNTWKGECQRCSAKSSAHTMSWFNTDLICMDCSNAEKDHPKYQEAKAKELDEVEKGNLNYEGIGWSANRNPSEGKRCWECGGVIPTADDGPYDASILCDCSPSRNPRGCYPCPECGTLMYEATHSYGYGNKGGTGAHCSCHKCGANFITQELTRNPGKCSDCNGKRWRPEKPTAEDYERAKLFGLSVDEVVPLEPCSTCSPLRNPDDLQKAIHDIEKEFGKGTLEAKVEIAKLRASMATRRNPKTVLLKDSCCCGATKAAPCDCMKMGVMQCSATCPCSGNSKHEGETRRNSCGCGSKSNFRKNGCGCGNNLRRNARGTKVKHEQIERLLPNWLHKSKVVGAKDSYTGQMLYEMEYDGETFELHVEKGVRHEESYRQYAPGSSRHDPWIKPAYLELTAAFKSTKKKKSTIVEKYLITHEVKGKQYRSIWTMPPIDIYGIYKRGDSGPNDPPYVPMEEDDNLWVSMVDMISPDSEAILNFDGTLHLESLAAQLRNYSGKLNKNGWIKGHNLWESYKIEITDNSNLLEQYEDELNEILNPKSKSAPLTKREAKAALPSWDIDKWGSQIVAKKTFKFDSLSEMREFAAMLVDNDNARGIIKKKADPQNIQIEAIIGKELVFDNECEELAEKLDSDYIIARRNPSNDPHSFVIVRHVGRGFAGQVYKEVEKFLSLDEAQEAYDKNYSTKPLHYVGKRYSSDPDREQYRQYQIFPRRNPSNFDEKIRESIVEHTPTKPDPHPNFWEDIGGYKKHLGTIAGVIDVYVGFGQRKDGERGLEIGTGLPFTGDEYPWATKSYNVNYEEGKGWEAYEYITDEMGRMYEEWAKSMNLPIIDYSAGDHDLLLLGYPYDQTSNESWQKYMALTNCDHSNYKEKVADVEGDQYLLTLECLECGKIASGQMAIQWTRRNRNNPSSPKGDLGHENPQKYSGHILDFRDHMVIVADGKSRYYLDIDDVDATTKTPIDNLDVGDRVAFTGFDMTDSNGKNYGVKVKTFDWEEA